MPSCFCTEPQFPHLYRTGWGDLRALQQLGNGRTPCSRVLSSRAVWAPAFVSFSASMSLLGVMQRPDSPMGTSPSSKPPPAPGNLAARPRSLSVNGRGRLWRQQDRLCGPAPQFPRAEGAAVVLVCRLATLPRSWDLQGPIPSEEIKTFIKSPKGLLSFPRRILTALVFYSPFHFPSSERPAPF